MPSRTCSWVNILVDPRTTLLLINQILGLGLHLLKFQSPFNKCQEDQNEIKRIMSTDMNTFNKALLILIMNSLSLPYSFGVDDRTSLVKNTTEIDANILAVLPKGEKC